MIFKNHIFLYRTAPVKLFYIIIGDENHKGVYMSFSIKKSMTTIAALSLATTTFAAPTTQQNESIADAFKNGTFSGYIRLHHITGGDPVAKNGSAIGGKLKYETGALAGFSAGAAFYTSQDTGYTKPDNGPAQGLLGDNLEDYSALGEAYINYKSKEMNVRLGRQEFKTPMTENPVTLIPNLFEGVVLTSNAIPDLSLNISHITKIQYGTRSATEKLLIGDVAYAMTAGTGEGLETATGAFGATTTKGKGSFMSIGRAALGSTAGSTSGMTVLSATYKGIKNLSIRAWDYYSWDIMNTLYMDADYTNKIGDVGVKLSAQYLNQKDVGSYPRSASIRTRLSQYNSNTDKFVAQNLWAQLIDANGNIDSSMYGAKLELSAYGLTVMGALNKNGNGHVINPYGGDPAYTTMIFARNEYRADTDAYKVGLKYNFEKIGVKGLVFDVSRAVYDTDAVYYTTATGNATTARNETTKVNDYNIVYSPPSMKALMLRFFIEQRDNGTRAYDQYHSRFIANYNF